MTIGKELATARRKKGIDIKNAEEATKIRVKFLEALENDDYENVPEPVYIKGFIRTYATFLGINSFDLVKKYEAILERENKKQEADEEENKKNNKHNARGCVVDPGIIESPAEYRSRKILHLFLLVFATVIISILILGILGTIGPQSKISERVPVNSAITKKKKSKQKKKQPIVITGVLIRLVSKRSTWLRIKKDGLLYFVGTLRSKKELKIHAKKNIEILTVDGTAFKVYEKNKYIGLIAKDKGPTKRIFGENNQAGDKAKK